MKRILPLVALVLCYGTAWSLEQYTPTVNMASSYECQRPNKCNPGPTGTVRPSENKGKRHTR